MAAEAIYGPVLIGMRGAGKSTIAPIVAKLLKLDCADSDSVVEEREGQTVAEIFASRGEAKFRIIERRIVLGLLEKTRTALSLGGGAVLDAEVRAKLAQRPAIWLDAGPAELARRIRGSGRPSITGQKIELELHAVLEHRRHFYQECAAARIDTVALAPEQTVAEVAALWAEWLNARKETCGNGF